MEFVKEELKDKITKVYIGKELSDDKKNAKGSIELDIENQTRFVDMVHSVLEEGAKKIMIDMSNVIYIDSSGLWALFEGHKKADASNSKLVLLTPTKDVKRVLDITKMSEKMGVCMSESEAIQKLEN